MPSAVQVKRLPGNDLPLPAYQTEHAAGLDLLACVADDVVLEPLVPVLIPTGIAVAIPEGYELQIRPRSGLAVRHGVTVVNSPGTVDADYRGEVAVGLVLLSREPFTVRRGDRIAQAVLKKVERLEWQETQDLPGTARGSGGFGSTGSR